MLVNVPVTLCSGQPAHFIYSQKDGRFYRALNNKIIWVGQKGSSFNSSNKAYFNELFNSQLSLEKVYKAISTDAFMRKAVGDFQGLRVTKNDVWETACCFILSSNNSLQNIRNATQNLMKAFGGKTDGLHEFPAIDSIAKANLNSLKKCKCGFRADYLKQAAKSIKENEWILNEKNPEAIHDFFISLKGIGPKITQAILLFGYGFLDAFPIDVWVERGMAKHYFGNRKASHALITAKAGKLWHPFEGIAQQYLYYEFVKDKAKPSSMVCFPNK
ncbi:DNA-3-methyladenine glycosylase 2 family protein [archaeon]|nr:DNA-3-methyladenine glycosylase 2 family protein [archaeon]